MHTFAIKVDQIGNVQKTHKIMCSQYQILKGKTFKIDNSSFDIVVDFYLWDWIESTVVRLRYTNIVTINLIGILKIVCS